MTGTLIGVLVVVAVALLGCTAEPSGVPSGGSAADIQAEIDDVVRRYFDAVNAGDLEKLNGASCAAAHRRRAAPPLLPTVVREVGIADISGDSATVPVALSIDDGGPPSAPSTVTLGLVEEDGWWKFCMVERAASA